MLWILAYTFISIYSAIGLYLFKSKVSESISKFFALISFVLSLSFVFCINLSRDIMSDSIGYEGYFKALQRVDFLSFFSYIDNFEIGFRFYTWFLAFFFSDVHIYFAITASFIFLVTSLSLFNIFDKYLAMFVSTLYIGLPWFVLYSASGIRQGLALSFVLLSLSFLLKNKNILSFLFYLVAISFHKTAVLLIPVYIVYLGKLQINKALFFYVLLVLGSYFNFFNSVITSFIDIDNLSPRDRVYFSGSNETYQTGFRIDFTLFSIFPILLYIYTTKDKEKCTNLDNWILIYLVTNGFMHIFSFVPYYDRVAAFSWFFYPVIYALIVLKFKNNFFSFMCLLGFVILNIVLFRFYNWGWYFAS